MGIPTVTSRMLETPLSKKEQADPLFNYQNGFTLKKNHRKVEK